MIKNSYYFAIISFFLLFTFSNQLNAQVKSTNKSLESFIYGFSKAYSDLAKTKKKETVLQYFHKKSTVDITFVNIANRTNVMRGGYENFADHLDNMVRDEGISISHKVGDILNTIVRDDIGIASYVDHYSISQSGSMLVKGTQLVNIICKKIAGEWKCIHYSIIEIEDEKIKGICLCELFESMGKEAEYVSKTTLPRGSNYATTLDNFVFRTVADGKMVRTGHSIYKWDKSGKVFKQEEEGVKMEMLGTTLDHDEVIKIILEEDIYSENCTSIKVKS
ncbi:hypothetical protein R9C00_26315 [Flammeovirgaceae bacterium SG7u.111]|nr:hypothetical protein [Flammeovirgaceae bacterium SG7u.132]WPO35214.1 hypothetical protein R9C00_26315 [Flammeovirgaceae bacterium SG7u.111]